MAFARSNNKVKNFKTYMSPHVDFETASSRITFAAEVTTVGLVARMYQFMGFQMPLSDKALTTAFITAHIRTLTSLIHN
jgi:hypothetical protein